MKPTFAADRGPWKGNPESWRAADAPIIDITSASSFLSIDITVQIIWTSLPKPLGKSGLIGLSMSLDVKTSFSEGLPSRRKKLPGIFPEA